MSFINICDNKVYDLLNKNTTQLTLLEDPNKGLIIPKITEK